MTVKECYEKIGGDYSEVVNRLMTDERITRFAGMFLDDDSYRKLVDAMGEGDYDLAFRMAHTMKGVTQNLSFEALYQPVNEITEALRDTHRDVELAESLLPTVTKQYEITVAGIRELIG